MKTFADEALPGMTTALDTQALVALLRESLPECREGIDVIDGQVFDVQYRPGAECLVLYRLKVRDQERSRSARQFVSVHASREGKCPAPPVASVVSQYRSLEGSVLRTPFLHVPRAALNVYAFPLDPTLGHLLDVLDPASMRSVLSRTWQDGRVRVRRVRGGMLGYTPQARAAIRYEVLSEHRKSRVPEIRHLVGKTHAYKCAAARFADAWALWRAANLRVRMAAPVGYCAPLNLSLQEWVPGVRLGDLAGTPEFFGAVRTTARSIADIHRLRVPAQATRTADKEIQGVRRWSRVLAAVRPDQARRMSSLCERFAVQLAERARITGVVHGDFHPANVLVDGDDVTLIDMDQMAHGDPLVDVGRFLASLRVSALRVSGDPRALHEAAEAFLNLYLDRSGEEERRARLFEGANLLTAAATGFRLQRKGWAENALVLIEEAESALRAAETAAAVGATKAGQGARRALHHNGVDWTLDSQYMRTVLDPHVRKAFGVDLTSCHVRMRSVAGRERRVRYRLSGWRGGTKWKMTVNAYVNSSASRSSFERFKRLHRALDERAEGGLVERPIAYIRQLGLYVVEPIDGAPFSSLVVASQGAQVARRVARGLTCLHATRADINRERSIEAELRTVREQAEKIRAINPEYYTRASALLEAAASRIRRVTPCFAPVLRKLPLNRILCSDQHVAFTEVKDVRLSHPLLDAADVAVRLATLKDGQDDIVDVTHAFREAYAAATGFTLFELASFETVRLVRTACAKVRRGHSTQTSEQMLSLAEQRLSAQWERRAC